MRWEITCYWEEKLILLLFFLKLMTNSLYDNMCVKMDYRYTWKKRKPILTAFSFQSRERKEEEKNSFEHHWIVYASNNNNTHIYIDNRERKREKTWYHYQHRIIISRHYTRVCRSYHLTYIISRNHFERCRQNRLLKSMSRDDQVLHNTFVYSR